VTDMFDRLKGEPAVFDSETTVYDLAQVRALATRCVDLGGDAVLALRLGDDYANHVSFVVLEFAYGPTLKNGVQVDGVKMAHVFSGSGFGDGLRELRHSTWGEGNNGGYMHSPSGGVIVAALVALQEWFDLGLGS
jgi:hypothetical protein